MNDYAICFSCLFVLSLSIAVYTTAHRNRNIYTPITPNYYDMLGISYNSDIIIDQHLFKAKRNCKLCELISARIKNASLTLSMPKTRADYNQYNHIPITKRMVHLTENNFYTLTIRNIWLVLVDPTEEIEPILYDAIYVGYMYTTYDTKLLRYLHIQSSTQYFIYSPYKIIQFSKEFDQTRLKSDIRQSIIQSLPLMTFDNINEVLHYEYLDIQPYELPALNKFCFSFAPDNISKTSFDYILMVLKYGDIIEFSLISDMHKHRVMKRFNKLLTNNVIISHSKIYSKIQQIRMVLSSDFKLNDLDAMGLVIQSHTIIHLFKENIRNFCIHKQCIILLYSSNAIISPKYLDNYTSFQENALQNFAQEIYTLANEPIQFATIDLDWHPKLKEHLNLSVDGFAYMLYRFDVSAYSISYGFGNIRQFEREYELIELDLGTLMCKSDWYISVIIYKAFGSIICLIAGILVIGWILIRNKAIFVLSCALILCMGSYLLIKTQFYY